MQIKLSQPILNLEGKPFKEGPQDEQKEITLQDVLISALKLGHDRQASPTISQIADDHKLGRSLAAKVDEISLPSEKVSYLKECLVKMVPNAGWDRIFVGCILETLEPTKEETKLEAVK